MRPYAATRALRGRLYLLAAWLCPGLLTLPGAPTRTAALTGLLVALGLAGTPAFLPGGFWRAACALTLLCLPFTAWWCGYAAANGAGPGFDAAVAALQTNTGEALGAVYYCMSSPAFLFAFTVHLAFLFMACRAAWSPNHTPPSPRIVQTALLFAILPLAAVALISDYTHRMDLRSHPLFGAQTLVSPLGSAEEIVAAKIRLLISYHEQDYRRTHAPALGMKTAPVLAILYLGESVRADGYTPHMGVKGGFRQKLAQRIDAGLGAWLPTTCAAADGTHLSVPLILTATPPSVDAQNKAAIAPTVLGILKASGFRTAWLSNNEAGPNAREAGHDFYYGSFDPDPDDAYAEHVKQLRFDTELVPIARSFAGGSSNPTAILMHTMGSHIPYDWRYPADFFPAETRNLGRDELKELRYDRSLEFGAHVLLDTADVLDAASVPAFPVYTSDHGENLPGDHNGLQIHLSPRTSIEDGTVPSFVLWNKAMADSGRPPKVLSKLVQAPMIAHADVARVFLALAQGTSDAVQPTPNPTTWGRVAVGEPYGVVPCADLKP